MNKVVFCLALMITHMVCSGQVPGNIPLNGLKAYFGFNNELRDESGNGVVFRNQGVVFETTPSASGTVTSARFNGTPIAAKYLEAATPSIFRQATYSYYITFKANEYRPLNNGGVNFFYQSILAFCPPNWRWGAAYMLALNQTDNSELYTGHWLESGSAAIKTPSGGVKLDVWKRALVTYDGNKLSLYLDCKLVNSKSVGLSYDNQVAFIIGGAKDESDGRVMGGFSGNIDDFAFWDRALTDQEVTRLFEKPSEPECLEYRRVSSIQYDTKKEITWTSPALQKGVRYRITGKGVWTPNGGFSQADCEYEYFQPCTIRNPSAGVRLGFSLESALSDELKFKPVENDIDCDSHTYHYDVVGDGRPLYVLFRDIVVADNSGLIEVTIDECLSCSVSQPSDSILGYRSTETHQVVTYALRNKPELSYQWIATGGYLLGETTKHYCDVIWGYDKTGSVCCIVSDSTCTDTICIDVNINNATTGGIAGDVPNEPTMSARPNPTSDMIDISSVDATDATSYTLVDVTGRVLQQVHGQRVRMSVEDVPSGVYHLLMKNAEGTVVAMQRVVVQK